MIVLDTNIWVYAHDDRDLRKRDIALQLIKTARPLALPWQVGCEFIAASRKLQPFGMSQDDAWNFLQDMQRSADLLLLLDPVLWTQSRALAQRHGLSFWDALLVAACLGGGVRQLYSEDIAVRGRTMPGLMPVNPFA
jgi:predicted nucleic acid-binding protein